MRAGRRDARAALATAAIAITSLLVAAPAANAAFGLNGLQATPASTQAGANTNFAIHLGITDPGHDLKNLTIHLPPGLVGNPLATTTCTEAQLNANSCPALSQVGTVSNDVLLSVLGLIDLPQTVTGKIYNVVPRAGEPARFGIVLSALPLGLPPPLDNLILPPIILQSPASLRQSDLGLDTVLNDLPRQAEVALGVTADITITGVTLTLNGTAGSPPQGFIRLPTSCKTHTVGFDATAWDNQTASGQATFTTVGCASEPFAPGFKAKLKPMGRNGLKPEVQTTITQTIQEAGLQRAQVILPPELGADNSVLDRQCPQAQFAGGRGPQKKTTGSAVAPSPLQSQPLTGTVALLAPPTPGLPQVGLDLRGPLALKLKGDFVFTATSTGVVFDGLPDIPISTFQLTFTGGNDGLVLAARQVCDPPPLMFSTNFLSHSGATRTGSTPATIDGTCKGGKHPGKKKPKVKIRLGRLGSDEPTMGVKVKAGSEKLKRAKLKLPRQLRFASGKAFDQGSSATKVSLKHTAGSLTMKARKPAKRMRAKFADGALEPGKGLRSGQRLKFKVAVRDASGKTTKLIVRAK
jgi:hypothetical protein